MLRLLEYLLTITGQAYHKLQSNNQTTNPLPDRLNMLLIEFNYHLTESIKSIENKEKLKTHMSIVYRDGEMIHEMYIMIRRTDNIPLKTEIVAIEEGLKQLAPYIVKIFGYEQAMYIVTPHYQQISGIWR